jgi:hypothetical protein
VGLTRDCITRNSAWLVAGVLALGHPSVTHGQAAVSAAHLAADLRGTDGTASVTIQYELLGADDLEVVNLELLGFGPAFADEVSVVEGERLVLSPMSGSRRGAAATLLPSGDGARKQIVLEYRALSAVELRGGAVRVRIPVVTVSLPPATDSAEVFTATLDLPRAWRVQEGFPSSLREREPGVYVATLPVVPSVVSLRGNTDGIWRPSVILLADLVIALVMAWVALAGWRRLRAVSG